MNFRSAKIVCTLGPASNSEEMIEKLMRAGMDVARLNFSHGTHDDHAQTIKRSARCVCTSREAHRHSRRFAGAEDPHRIAGESQACPIERGTALYDFHA